MSTLKTTNITHGGNTGTSNIVLDSSGNATVNGNLTVTGTGNGLYDAYAQMRHIVAASSGSYTPPSEGWEVRPITHELDPSSIVTVDLTNNRFTLAAGNYLIKWYENFYDTSDAADRIATWDGSSYTTVDAVWGIGVGTYSNPTHPNIVSINGSARVTPTGSTTYALQHHVDDNANSHSAGKDHLGLDTNNCYAMIEIWRET